MSEMKLMVVISTFCLLVISVLWLDEIGQMVGIDSAEKNVQAIRKDNTAALPAGNDQ